MIRRVALGLGISFLPLRNTATGSSVDAGAPRST